MAGGVHVRKAMNTQPQPCHLKVMPIIKRLFEFALDGPAEVVGDGHGEINDLYHD